jgi:hypothetical protein
MPRNLARSLYGTHTVVVAYSPIFCMFSTETSIASPASVLFTPYAARGWDCLRILPKASELVGGEWAELHTTKGHLNERRYRPRKEKRTSRKYDPKDVQVGVDRLQVQGDREVDAVDTNNKKHNEVENDCMNRRDLTRITRQVL